MSGRQNSGQLACRNADLAAVRDVDGRTVERELRSEAESAGLPSSETLVAEGAFDLSRKTTKTEPAGSNSIGTKVRPYFCS